MIKHEPTTSYFHPVRQLAKCMMRSDQLNRYNHSSYAENTAVSSNVNVTDEEESKEIIVHETLSDNQSKDVSESEYNIAHKTLSQNNSADVPDNAIMELKDKEHKEPSVTEKVTSYFNIFDRGRNLLDQLDLTYQQSFMATSAQDEYYKEMRKILVIANIHGRKLGYEKIQQSVIDLRAELNLEQERNINNISCDNEYTSPMKKKEVSTIRDPVYYESDENADKIIDSRKPVDASNDPITYTHIVEVIHNLSVRILSVKPAIIGVGIIV